MAALHALGEQGGWPLTMFLTPEGEPFWGGTYFPPEPRWGRPSFPQVLRGVADAYHTQQDAVRENAARAARGAGRRWRRTIPARPPGRRRSAGLPRRCCGWSIPSAAGSRARPSSRTRRSSASSGRTPAAPARRRAPTRCTCCWHGCRRAASTTISAAASPATRPTPRGWCRISRRCSTTTPSSSNCWPSPTPTARNRCIASGRRRPWAGCCATCAPPPSTATRPSPPRRTPTARARKGASTSGPRPRSTPCSAPTAWRSSVPTT